MTLLKKDLCPQLTETVLNQCHAADIKTVTDFVTCDPEDLVKIIKIPYKDIVSIKHFLIAKYAAFPQDGDSLYNELVNSLSILDTGSKVINKFLSGGIYTGEVTEIHGSPGSGKTQFTMSVISKLITSSMNTAIYIDTSNNFDAKRMEQIMLHHSNNDRVSIKAVLQNLQNVRVKNVYNIYEFFNHLDLIKTELRKKENLFFNHLKLLVVDSVTHLLSTCFGGMGLDGPGFVGNVAQQFKILCSDHMLSVLVCNNVVSDKANSVKPALGPNWKYVPSVSLSLSKINSNNYKMSTVKSCRNGLYDQASFRVTDGGISD